VKSIRRELRLSLCTGALILLLAATGLLYFGVRWLLVGQFDAGLRAKLGTFTTLIEQDGDDVELDFIDVAMPEFSADTQLEYVQMWLADRTDDYVLYRSPSLGQAHLPRLRGTESEPSFQDLHLPDGRSGRAIGAEFTIREYSPGKVNRPPARVALALAKGTDGLDAALNALLAGTLGLIFLFLAAGYLLVGGALRRGLRPLERFACHVGAVQDLARAQPFDAQGIPAELVPLVERHNQMLGRLRKAFERERRTAANIAHELRTPVAELVALTDLAHSNGNEASESARVLGELRELGQQMSGQIATLLELARMEMGQTPLEIEAIDLPELVRDCWAPLASPARAKRQEFEPPAGRGPLVRADRVALSILLSNLLRNAVEHAPDGDHIRCTIAVRESSCLLVLANQAGALVASDAELLGEPFWRASAARDDRTHAGLGLTLARRLAELLGVELDLRVDGRQFKVGVRLQVAAA
jgi:two-component system sensor histidine kinase QseC